MGEEWVRQMKKGRGRKRNDTSECRAAMDKTSGGDSCRG